MNKRKKSRKKEYIWCGAGALLILGSSIALMKLVSSRQDKEPARSQPGTPEQEKKLSEIQVKTPEQVKEPAKSQPGVPEQEKESDKNQQETTLQEVSVHNVRRERKAGKLAKYVGGGLYFILVMGICIVPLLLLWIWPMEATAENRTMASLPEIQTAEGFNWNFLSEAGDYFTDHFAFRQEMVSINSGIRSEIFGVSPVGDVIVGTDGWLYYAATLDDYQHKNSVSERMLFNIAHNVALMQEYSEGLGKTFVFTIAPNKNSLYDENMPERLRFQVAEKSDAQRLLPWLIRENVNYVDLFEMFGEQEETLYYARDSHWNEKGAVMVYNALLDACGKQHETYQEAEPVQNPDYFGDLGVMLFPVGAKPENRLQYPVGDTWYYAEGAQVEDQYIRTENEEGEGNLLMYRDSFGNSLLPYMAQTFSQTVFSKQIPYPMSDLVTCEPDILIVEKVERHLPSLGKVPPLMSAPIRKIEKECISVENTAATVQLSREGSYWKLEGVADPTYMDTDSRIYVEVDDGSDVKLYEAFCISSSDIKSGSTNDYGYALYVSELMLTGDTFNVRVMIEQEEKMIVLLKEEIPVMQKKESLTETQLEEEKEEAFKESETEETIKDEEENIVLEESRQEDEQVQEEQTSDVEKTTEENKKQEKVKPQKEVQQKVKPQKETQERVELQAETAAQAQQEAQAAVQEQAETQAAAQTRTAAQDQGQTAVTEVSRIYVEDCGSDSGYWVITYSDGHVEYLDD